MNPILFHIWGPLSIHAYGVFIAIGSCLSLFLALQDSKLKKIISLDDFITSVQLIALAGFFGGRIFCAILEEQPQADIWFIFKFWEPGFSILGSVIGATITLICYLIYKKIPILQYTDRAALYIPLVQSFGRIGCFFAGCCYGTPCSYPWAITYTHQNHLAPLYQSLHPTQLYSSFILFSIFCFLFFFLQHRTKRTGVLFYTYLLCISFERFCIDFMRSDRVLTHISALSTSLSSHQIIALGIGSFAIICLGYILYGTKKNGSI